ncbi:hypothetical protein TNCV_4750041 [Trichonephila clavipes]|nr:hypothetical protein TNCV_4750041 [Trichonephila clavipes]
MKYSEGESPECLMVIDLWDVAYCVFSLHSVLYYLFYVSGLSWLADLKTGCLEQTSPDTIEPSYDLGAYLCHRYQQRFYHLSNGMARNGLGVLSWKGVPVADSLWMEVKEYFA